VCISRAAAQIEFPAQFQLIAAMNPCPCGQWGNNQANCLCTPERINRYLGKLSAPLLDRIDIHITVNALSQEELIQTNHSSQPQSLVIKEQVMRIRTLQTARQNCLNSQLSAKACEQLCELGEGEREFLHHAMTKLKLSARGYHRLLKVARTIADIDEKNTVQITHLQQALTFKQVLQMPR
jgi:magnesium chelatase family protein